MSANDNNALVERVWTLFDKWQLTPEQIDRELCLSLGTAKKLLFVKWHSIGKVA